MNIKTKYNIKDVVFVGKQVFYIKRIHIEVGLRFPHFSPSRTEVMYSIERPDGTDWCKVPVSLISGKAKESDWVKAGGKLEEKKK
jgi:hypothetical protein